MKIVVKRDETTIDKELKWEGKKLKNRFYVLVDHLLVVTVNRQQLRILTICDLQWINSFL